MQCVVVLCCAFDRLLVALARYVGSFWVLKIHRYGTYAVLLFVDIALLFPLLLRSGESYGGPVSVLSRIVFCVDVWSIRGRFGVGLGSVWDRLGVGLGSIWSIWGIVGGIGINLVRKGIVRKGIVRLGSAWSIWRESWIFGGRFRQEGHRQ